MELSKQTKRYSESWNYFKKLEQLLAKCRICGTEIRVSGNNMTRALRAHLRKHHNFSDKNCKIPNDLRQYYLDLPEYKAKCNKCGKIISYLTQYNLLRQHLNNKHNTIIQSRHETDTIELSKRNELWNYFEQLKHLLAKCRICGEEIRSSCQSNLVKNLRTHLLKKHDMFPDKNHTLPDKLRQYYSDLSKYKAKCNTCGKIISYLTDYHPLRRHLKIHPDLINQSQHEPSTSSSTKNVIDPSAEYQSQKQEPLGLHVESCKEMSEEAGSLDDPSTGYAVNSIVKHPSQEHDLPVQLCEQTSEETDAFDEFTISTLSSMNCLMDLSAESQEELKLFLQSLEQTGNETGALDEPSSLSPTDYVMDPSAVRQSQESSSVPVLLAKRIRETLDTIDESAVSNNSGSPLADIVSLMSDQQSWTLLPYEKP